MTIDIEVEKVEKETKKPFGGSPEVVVNATKEARASFAHKAKEYIRGVWEGARTTLVIVAKMTLYVIGGGVIAALASMAAAALAASSADGDVRIFRWAYAGLQFAGTAIAVGYLVASLGQLRMYSLAAALVAVYIMVTGFGAVTSTPDLTVWRYLRYDTARMQTVNPQSRSVMEWLKGAPKPPES